MEFEIGDFVRTANNRQGTVRYIGGVTGKPDIWVGLELDGPEGKNDGSVQGERYFDCAPLHGIFTKYSDITHLIQSASVPAPSPSPAPRKVPSRLGAKPPAKAPAARPPSTTTTRTQRLSSVGSASAAAGTRSPTKPSSRLSGVASPTKPPPRRLSGVGASAAAAAAKHPTQTRPSLSQTRSPAVGTTRPTSQSARPSGVSGTKSAPQPSLTKRQSIGGSSAGGARTGLTRKLSTTGSSTSSVGGTTRNAAPSSTTSAATSKTPKDPASQALETRVRQLEKQHAEQQATIEELMPYKAKSEKHEALALKVSKKYQDVHQELLEAKREAASAKAESEKAREEFEINLENAILDKETAEVERDQLLDQTEMLKATIEELQLDKEIYEAEAEASLIIDEDMSDEQAQAVHIRKLQAENKRLRAVIIDFRDIDKERQADTKRLRHELETTTEAAEESAKQCTELRLKVEQHESTITTLQEQLDANNEWEEILEDVTQRANNLEEKNMRQSLEIKELETVNEVSTETIAEYVEFTNDLQAEASLRETELAELSRELEQERIQNAQKDMTLAKYSEAFADFQHQLQDQDMQQLMSEERAQGMTDKFNKMMDLHRTLQADRAKDTAKTIETELTKLSEQEAREELEILKNYLPETSTDYMDNSLRTYFRAKKIAYKASLIGSVLTGMETFTNEGAEKVLTNVYRHDTVYHLDYIRSHGEHFVATLANCTLEQFRKAVTEYEDISVVETTIDRTLDNLKRDELNMKDLSESIRGTDKIMRGITSISQRLSSNRPDNDLVLYVSLLRSSLERIRASFDAVKQYTQLVADFEPETEDRLDALVERLRKPQTSALECIAVVGKLSQALLTLQNDDLYPQFPSGAQEVLELSDNLSSYADKAHEFTRQVITFDPNDEDETPSVDIEELTSTIDSAMNIFSPKDMDGLLKDIKSNVAHWFEYASILNNTAEIERLPSPWIVRAQEIEASKKHAIDSEKKLQLLTTEHQSTLIQIREREEIIDTKDLEIEHLRAKHKEAVAKTEALDQVQKELQDAKNEQATYKREIKKHVDEIEQLKHSAAEMLRSSPNASTPNAAVPTENAAPTGTAATHKADKKKPTVDDELVSGSFATFIKALKKENTWLRQREYAASMARAAEFLPPLRKIPDSRHRMARAEELLEMAWSLPSLQSPDTVGNEEARSSSKKSGKPSSLRIYDPDVSLVDDLCFVDLEPVADGFDELLLDEMMR